MRDRVAKIEVPIYNADFYFAISDNIKKTRDRFSAIFGDYDASSSHAVCSSSSRVVGVFITRSHLCREILARELFHAAHNLLESIGTTDKDHGDEPFAYLNGWMHEKAYKKLKQRGEKIK